MTATVETKWNGQDVKLRGRRAVDKSAFEIGIIVEGQAKALTPIKSGRLAGSITVQAASGEGTGPQAPAGSSDVIQAPQEEGEVYVGTAVEYAPYVEFGTIRMNAQPFLRPALDLAKGKALTVVMHNGRTEFAEYLK
jgi:HK97 gp10 family phage protein